MNKSIKIFSPATVSNVGSGFDILGFAIDNIGDEIIIKKNDTNDIKLIDKTEYKLPLNPKKNTLGIALIKYLEYIDSNQGFDITFTKKIMPGSGVGSSAASSAAGLFGANLLLNNPLEKRKLVEFGLEGEKIASGVKHADNVAPAIMGGFVLIRSVEPLDIINIDFPKNLHVSILHPQIEIKTEDSRNILNKNIKLSDAVKQWGNIAGLITGLYKSDYKLISNSMNDIIVEPVRSILIPEFNKIKETAIRNGALGCSISGSGPSIFALSKNFETASKVANSMKLVLDKINLKNKIYVSKISMEGAKELKS